MDVKVGGQWWFHYGYASNSSLVDKGDTGKHNDRFRARQRTRTQIQFIASENLSAMLNFENNLEWGNSSKGGDGPYNTYGAIEADNSTFVIKHAYLNWIIPDTRTQIRMGMQGIALPTILAANAVLSADMAGISVSHQFTPEVGLTAFWGRPYDSYNDSEQIKGKNSFDEVDVFGLVVPIKTDAVRFSPWTTFAMIGKDSGWYGNRTIGGSTVKDVDNKDVIVNGTTISGTDRNYAYRPIGSKDKFDGTGYGWWFGASFELPVLDPFFVKIDAMYGMLKTGDSDYDMSGWLVGADIGYKFSWASVSAIGWYSSGDDDEEDYGQLPIISSDGAFNLTGAGGGFYGLAGNSWRRFDGYLSNSGQGLWGLGFKITDVSFVDNLKHTLLGMWYGGTNEGDSQPIRRSVTGFNGRKLVTSDHAWELTLVNDYKVNDNLSFRFDIGYIDLELGDHWADKNSTKGNFFGGIGAQYMF